MKSEDFAEEQTILRANCRRAFLNILKNSEHWAALRMLVEIYLCHSFKAALVGKLKCVSAIILHIFMTNSGMCALQWHSELIILIGFSPVNVILKNSCASEWKTANNCDKFWPKVILNVQCTHLTVNKLQSFQVSFFYFLLLSVKWISFWSELIGSKEIFILRRKIWTLFCVTWGLAS